MAARRNFRGASQAQLEAWLADVNEEIATGKVNTDFGAGDTNFRAAVDGRLSPERRRNLLLADLSILDPATYPPDEVTPVRITTARFADLN
jgi:hypothetical protein